VIWGRGAFARKPLDTADKSEHALDSLAQPTSQFVLLAHHPRVAPLQAEHWEIMTSIHAGNNCRACSSAPSEVARAKIGRVSFIDFQNLIDHAHRETSLREFSLKFSLELMSQLSLCTLTRPFRCRGLLDATALRSHLAVALDSGRNIAL
jgi:hypothetical protein